MDLEKLVTFDVEARINSIKPSKQMLESDPDKSMYPELLFLGTDFG
jgi:hypothetical protein